MMGDLSMATLPIGQPDSRVHTLCPLGARESQLAALPGSGVSK